MQHVASIDFELLQTDICLVYALEFGCKQVLDEAPGDWLVMYTELVKQCFRKMSKLNDQRLREALLTSISVLRLKLDHGELVKHYNLLSKVVNTRKVNLIYAIDLILE